jgi:hypothetical protein
MSLSRFEVMKKWVSKIVKPSCEIGMSIWCDVDSTLLNLDGLGNVIKVHWNLEAMEEQACEIIEPGWK